MRKWPRSYKCFRLSTLLVIWCDFFVGVFSWVHRKGGNKSILLNLGSASSIYLSCQLPKYKIQKVPKLPLLMRDIHENIAVPERHVYKCGIFTARHCHGRQIVRMCQVITCFLMSVNYRLLSQVCLYFSKYLFHICRKIHCQSVMYGKYVCKHYPNVQGKPTLTCWTGRGWRVPGGRTTPNG